MKEKKRQIKYRKYTDAQKAQVVYEFMQAMTDENIVNQKHPVRRGAEAAAQIDYERQLSNPENYQTAPRVLNIQSICEWYADATLNRSIGVGHELKKLKKIERERKKKSGEEAGNSSSPSIMKAT